MITLTNSTVLNQDDCVAITSGTGYIVRNMVCVGGHGLGIGSIGGKGGGEPDMNEVKDVLFEDCKLRDQTNGVRIKTNAGEVGLVRKYVFFPFVSLPSLLTSSTLSCLTLPYLALLFHDMINVRVGG